jgi:hypothetical protein
LAHQSNEMTGTREGTMKTLSQNWLIGAIGACAVVAGIALLVVVAASGDAIGRSVGTLIGGGFALGVLGCGLKEALARRDLHRLAPSASYAALPASIVAMPPTADATASEFDEIAQPAFAPVMSLTEAQVERQLAERRRQERSIALNRA